jgi:ABC-type protease/lipase transport system fused ATPase/permease subunit
MKNSEKILHVESMRDKALGAFKWTKRQIEIQKANNEDTWLSQQTLEAQINEYTALKYACKALQLLQDLVNDHEDNEQEVEND